jgi:hypothetical protein
VNSETAGEGVGRGTGWDGKVQADEDEDSRYGYQDPVIQLLFRSYRDARLGDQRGTYRVEKVQGPPPSLVTGVEQC